MAAVAMESSGANGRGYSQLLEKRLYAGMQTLARTVARKRLRFQKDCVETAARAPDGGGTSGRASAHDGNVAFNGGNAALNGGNAAIKRHAPPTPHSRYRGTERAW